MKDINKLLFVAAIGLAMVIQLVAPFAARADGDTTPIPTDITGITSTPLPPEPTSAPVETSMPIPTETPEVTSTAVPDDPAADSAETGTPTPPADLVEAITGTPELVETVPTEKTAEEPTLTELLQELPEGTDIVVLDENGDPEPLATQDAAEIIAQGDPMWCPAVVGVATVTTDCVYASTIGGLLPLLAGKDADGVIYFYTPTAYNINDITLDGAANPYLYALSDNTLTLQGGWDGVTTPGSTINFSGNSLITVPIQILNWNNTVTINNITVDGASGVGLGITTNGKDVNINNSQILNTKSGGSGYFPYGDGIDIYNAGKVTITGSTIQGNTYDGIYGYASQLEIRDSQFIGNGTNGYGRGIAMYNLQNVSFYNTLLDNNYDLSLGCYNPITSSYVYIVSNYPTSQLLDYVEVNTNCSFISIPPPIGVPTPAPIPTPVIVIKLEKRDADGKYFAPSSSSLVNFYLNCDNQPNFLVNLPNGDKVEIICPVRGNATISRLDNTILPGELPAGYTYASAFQLDISKLAEPLEEVDGKWKTEPVKVITEGGYVNISFVATPLQAGRKYAVLFWDDASQQWIPLKDFAYGRSFKLFPNDPNDLRYIRSGVQQDAHDVKVSTNFTGIYVLVQQ